MFGELIGAWAAAVWQQMGSPAKVHLVELGPGPRHLDGGCAARRDGAARISRCAVGASGRDQPGPARAAGANARGRRSDPLASTTIEEFPTVPRSSSRTSSSMRCRSISSCKDSDGWHAARRRHRRTASSASWSCRSRCRRTSDDAALTHRTARSSSCATTGRSSCCRSAHRQHGGAALIIDYGHAESRLRRHAAGGAQPQICRSARRSGRGRSHRASGFRARSPCGQRRQRRDDAWPDPARRIPAPARHRRARRAAQDERDAASRQPTSTARSRASPRRTRWASCSRCWRSPIRSSDRCRDLTVSTRSPSIAGAHDPRLLPSPLPTSATPSSHARAACPPASTKASTAASARKTRRRT